VLLTGAGDVFSAGLNLVEIAGSTRRACATYLGLLEDTIAALYHYPGPLVAFVNGHAIAGGCILALCCDHRVVRRARGSSSGSTRWRSGCGSRGGSAAGARRVAPQSLDEVVLGGRLYGPHDALRVGFVDELGDLEVARERLANLARTRRTGYAATKAELRAGVLVEDPAHPPRVPRRGAAGVDRAGPARAPAPAFIDSHVHLAYWPVGDELLDRGVATVVDLAAPIAWLDAPVVPPRLRVIASGPMITARRGYPTRGWGADGYGREVGGPREAEAAVDELHAHGARIIKLAITGAPMLAEDALRAAVARAHGLSSIKVVGHALADEEVRMAAAVGVDVLAHTPVEALGDADAWRGRAVNEAAGSRR
jgi:hypothetical protein